jgi:serine/threonine protein kinase
MPSNRSNYKLLNHRYVICEKIGSGGMSEIFTGYDRDYPTCIRKFKPVAIKVLSHEFIDCNEAIYSFETEYLIGQQLSHQSIVKFFDFVSDGTNYFLVMERLVGKTLNSIKNENSNLFTFELRISLLEKIINGLAYIHSRSIAHGDLKPSNIFICNDGTLKIIDFGLSSAGSSTSAFTWGGWFNVPSFTNIPMTRGGGTDSYPNGWNLATVFLSTAFNGSIITSVPGITQTNASYVSSPSSNTWYNHICVWNPGVSIKVYINGILRATQNTSNTVLRTSSQGWNTSIDGTKTNQSYGSMMVYNTALSDADVLQNFNSTKTRFGY